MNLKDVGLSEWQAVNKCRTKYKIHLHLQRHLGIIFPAGREFLGHQAVSGSSASVCPAKTTYLPTALKRRRQRITTKSTKNHGEERDALRNGAKNQRKKIRVRDGLKGGKKVPRKHAVSILP